MLLSEYLPVKCDTSRLMGLTQQIVEILKGGLEPNALIDVAAHVTPVGASTLTILQREAGEALIAAVAEKGRKPRLVHALRVLPQQYAVYYWYTHGRCDIPLAASPAASPHERAVAVDLDDFEDWIEVLQKHNWKWRGKEDRAHFNFRGPSDPDLSREAIRAFQKLWNLHNPNDKIDEDGSYGKETRKRLEASPIEGF